MYVSFTIEAHLLWGLDQIATDGRRNQESRGRRGRGSEPASGRRCAPLVHYCTIIPHLRLLQDQALLVGPQCQLSAPLHRLPLSLSLQNMSAYLSTPPTNHPAIAPHSPPQSSLLRVFPSRNLDLPPGCLRSHHHAPALPLLPVPPVYPSRVQGPMLRRLPLPIVSRWALEPFLSPTPSPRPRGSPLRGPMDKTTHRKTCAVRGGRSS